MRKTAAATHTTQIRKLRLVDRNRHVNTEHTVDVQMRGVRWDAEFCGELVDVTTTGAPEGNAYVTLRITDAIEWDEGTGPVPEGARGIGGLEYVGEEQLLLPLDEVVEVLL